jgi:hypothetical protein
MQERPAGILQSGLVLLSLVASLVILIAAVASAADAATAAEAGTDGPLVVPIFPRQDKDKQEPSDDSVPGLPAGEALRDSYIVLQDGSVLTTADWILGGLSKTRTGMGMTDYENRLFLGQVARAMAGQQEDLIHRSVVNAGPPRAYRPGPELPQALQITRAVLSMLLPGTPEDYDASKAGGGFNPRLRTEGEAAVLFEGQFSQAYFWSNGEFHERGTMMNMLRDYQKQAENGAPE